MSMSISSLSTSPLGFEWPWQYEFPPFFTLQPNSDTRSKQLEAWCDLILAYYRASKTYVMDLTEVSQSSPLFCNSKINRRLSPEAIRTVLETLESKGNVEWQDGKKDRCLVMWRTPQEWGQLVYQWAQDSGLSTSVCTLYEMHSGEDTTDQEFYGIEVWMLKRAIQALSRLGKAELIPGDNPDGSDAGVKFFS